LELVASSSCDATVGEVNESSLEIAVASAADWTIDPSGSSMDPLPLFDGFAALSALLLGGKMGAPRAKVEKRKVVKMLLNSMAARMDVDK
jgi:hypothetical protein